MNVCRERAHGAARRAGNGLCPQFNRQVFDEVRSDAIVRAPRSDQFVFFVNICVLGFTLPRFIGKALTTVPRLGYKARAMFRTDRSHHGYWHHHHTGGGLAIVLQALTN